MKVLESRAKFYVGEGQIFSDPAPVNNVDLVEFQFEIVLQGSQF